MSDSLKEWMAGLDGPEKASRPRTPFFPGKERKSAYEKAYRVFAWPGREEPGLVSRQHFHGPGKPPTECAGAEYNCPECLEALSLEQMQDDESKALADKKRAAVKIWVNAVCTETLNGSNTTDPNTMGILEMTMGQNRRFLGFAAKLGGYMGEKDFNAKDPEFFECVQQGLPKMLGPSGMDIIIKHEPHKMPKDRYSMRVRTKDNKPLSIAPDGGLDLKAVKDRLSKREE